MNLKRRLALARFAQVFPQFLANWGYCFIFYCYRMAMWPYARQIKIVYRHSLYEGRVVPFLSDIDVSFYSDKPLAVEKWQQALAQHQRVRSVLPLFNEVNVYSVSNWSLCQNLGNPVELTRDPLFERRPMHRDDKVVFFLRALFSDAEMLAIAPELRRLKWLGHFQAMELGAPPAELDPKNLCECVVKLLQLTAVDTNLASSAIQDLLQMRVRQKQSHLWEVNLNSNPWFWILNPQFFVHRPEPKASVPKEMMGIFESQLSWEVVGLSHQFLGFKDLSIPAAHLTNVIAALENLGQVNDKINTAKILLSSLLQIATQAPKKRDEINW